MAMLPYTELENSSAETHAACMYMMDVMESACIEITHDISSSFVSKESKCFTSSQMEELGIHLAMRLIYYFVSDTSLESVKPCDDTYVKTFLFLFYNLLYN